MPDETPVPETPVVETPVVETPVPVTLADTERKMQEKYFADRGIDPKKFRDDRPKPREAVKETPVVAKVETPVPEVKVETPEVVAKKKSRVARLFTKIGAIEESNRQLQAELVELRRGKVEAAAPVKVEPVLKEPARADFDTVEGWVAATRKYDKEVAEADLKTTKEQVERQTQEQQAVAEIAEFNKKLLVAKAKHDDWDDVTAKTTVQFNPILQGLLMAADPELLYEFALTPKEAKRLNTLTDTSVVAVGNSDDVTATMRFLTKNPDMIEELNELSPIKAAKFVGKLEARIEAEAKKPESSVPAKGDKVVAEPEVKVPAKTTPTATREPAPKPKPEPPPVMSGAPPATEDWRDPASMSLKDRERLMLQDPKFAKRGR